MDQRVFELMEKRKRAILPSPPTLIYKLSRTSMVWNISTGQLGLAAWLCSLQVLHTRSLAEHGKLENVLDFLVTTENICVMNILVY